MAHHVHRQQLVQHEGSGIEIPATSVDNTVSSNTTNANGVDGIHLGGPIFSNTFTDIGPTVLDLVTPDQPPFVEGTDFAVLPGSGSGNVTAQMVPVVAAGASAVIIFNEGSPGRVQQRRP